MQIYEILQFSSTKKIKCQKWECWDEGESEMMIEKRKIEGDECYLLRLQVQLSSRRPCCDCEVEESRYASATEENFYKLGWKNYEFEY